MNTCIHSYNHIHTYICIHTVYTRIHTYIHNITISIQSDAGDDAGREDEEDNKALLAELENLDEVDDATNTITNTKKSSSQR